jgi:hypothetical protein
MLTAVPNLTSAWHAIVRVLTEPRVFIPAIVFAWFLTGRLRAKWKQYARERQVRNWPTVTATIEVPAVISVPLSEKHSTSTVSLTYFYRNPDLQMGEYTRGFRQKAKAKAWAAQFKGRTVLVHVNPEDLSDSVLLEKDLAGNDLVTYLPAVHETPNWQVMPQVLSPGMRALCAVAEIVGLSGLATSAVMLLVSIATHGKLNPHGFYLAAGYMFGLCALSVIAITTKLGSTEDGRWLLRSYKQWCPGWMRWSLNITGSVSVFAPLYHFFNLFRLLKDLENFLERQPWSHSLAPHVPFAAGCWIFFVTTAFLASILRSQEELRIVVTST